MKRLNRALSFLFASFMFMSVGCKNKENRKVEENKNLYITEKIEKPQVIELELFEDSKEDTNNSDFNIKSLLMESATVVTNAKVNVRERPSKSSKRVGKVDRNVMLPLMGEYNGWYEVIYNNDFYYIYKKYADISYGYINTKDMINMGYINEKTVLYDINTLSKVIDVSKYETAEVYYETDKSYLVCINGYFGFINKDKLNFLNDNYIIIDLSTQKLNLYCDNKLLLETFVVTGKDSTPTYTGFFEIYDKKRNVYWEEFGVKVKYWMPFNRGEGIHDAAWRSEFGGDFYHNDGSMGCVNVDKNIASPIYKNVSVGTKVLVKR